MRDATPDQKRVHWIFGQVVWTPPAMGFSLGPSTLVSGSPTGGYYLDPQKASVESSASFLSGTALSAGGGFIFGGEYVWAGDAHTETHSAVQLGLYSPQAFGSVATSYQLPFRLGVRW